MLHLYILSLFKATSKDHLPQLLHRKHTADKLLEVVIKNVSALELKRYSSPPKDLIGPSLNFITFIL